MKIFRKLLGKRVTKEPQLNKAEYVLKGSWGTVRWEKQPFFKEEKKVPKESTKEDTQDTTSIRMVNVRSIGDAFYISTLVKENYVVIANYEFLSPYEQELFMKNLSVNLMKQGTHLDRISKTVLICGERGAVVNNTTLETPAKIYCIEKYFKKG